ncbi:hypothetical protein BD410DRAFT_824006 [Rickenella mellea]|uniref:WW domain-containing protein n=1 Tax=Rickenella mellea TaxID=50990 RepID=A0A4R5XFX8_9AGAM|nr:hypothetical protein BD410DRAFT_824006 [Rickenella mellea]
MSPQSSLATRETGQASFEMNTLRLDREQHNAAVGGNQPAHKLSPENPASVNVQSLRTPQPISQSPEPGERSAWKGKGRETSIDSEIILQHPEPFPPVQPMRSALPNLAQASGKPAGSAELPVSGKRRPIVSEIPPFKALRPSRPLPQRAAGIPQPQPAGPAVRTVQERNDDQWQRWQSRLFGEPPPVGWQRYNTPSGKVYFFDRKNVIVTPSDINKPEIRRLIEDNYGENIDEVKKLGIAEDVWTGWEMCVRVGKDESNLVVYFVDHECRRTIAVKDSKVIISEGDEAYWKHIQEYPMHTLLYTSTEDDLLASLVHGATERVLNSKRTIFPYDGQQCQSLLQMYNDIQGVRYKTRDANRIDGAFNWFAGMTMVDVSAAYKRHKFGTAEVQSQREPPSVWQPTKFVRAMDVGLYVLLFGMHAMYRQRLEGTRTKRGYIQSADFHDVMANFMKEWGDSNLLATVFVAANVAFLAIPDVTNIQKTVSLASTLCSMFSILAGVHHVWRHRTNVDADTTQSVDAEYNLISKKYLEFLSPTLGHDISITLTASLLSLPIVLLLWAVITFLVAICAYSLQNTSSTAQRVMLAVVMGMLVLGTLGTLVFFWGVWTDSACDDVQVEERARTVPLVWKIGQAVRRVTGRIKGALGRPVVRCLETLTSTATKLKYRGKSQSPQSGTDSSV